MTSIPGTWALVRVTSTDADGKALPSPLGGQPIGRVLLTDDARMIAVTCNGRPEVPAGESRDFSAYSGNYTTDGKTLVTRVFAASDPSRIGGDQVRDVRFEGEHMILRPPLRSYFGRPPETRELWWQRVGDAPASLNPKSIVGTWALERGICTSADGKALPAPYGGSAGLGRVAFTADGRMMAVLCDTSASLPAGAEREFNSYCGNFTFDGARLVTRVFANSAPDRLGGDQVREVSYDGDLMIFRPPTRSSGGVTSQRQLWWRKIAER